MINAEHPYLWWSHEIRRLRPLRDFGLRIIIIYAPICITSFLPKPRRTIDAIRSTHVAYNKNLKTLLGVDGR